MNKQQAQNYVRLSNELARHGLSETEISQLLRAERTLQRWAERECGDGSNWAIERDETADGSDGKPFLVYHADRDYSKPAVRYPIADREAGALRRVAKICGRHGLDFYHQTDPRGCALYVLRPGDVPAGQCVTGCYTRGVAVCL